MPVFALLARARPALAAFAAMGILWGTFAADLPDIKAMLGVDESRLGLLLFMTPIAGVLSMLIAPLAGVAFGRVALPVATVLMCLGFALPGQTASVWLFPIAMLAAGAGTGLTDVLMNARVADLENRGPPMMNLCHAGYSFGYAGGAICTGILRDNGFGPPMVFGLMASLALAVALISYEADGHIEGLRKPSGAGGAGLGLVPLIGGGMVFISFLTENAAESWSALHIEKTLGGSPAHGAMGPAIMAMTMGVSRLFGQGLALRIAAARLLLGGAVISACGAVTAALAISPNMAYAGFVVMGIGSSVIAPTAFSLVGQSADPQARARAVARATLVGYFGYFFGPPMFGFVAGHVGLRFAFVLAALMLAFIPVLSRILTKLD